MDITVLDDNILEPLETFSVTTSTSVNRIVLQPNTAVVEIVDNDGECEEWRVGRKG